MGLAANESTPLLDKSSLSSEEKRIPKFGDPDYKSYLGDFPTKDKKKEQGPLNPLVLKCFMIFNFVIGATGIAYSSYAISKDRLNQDFVMDRDFAISTMITSIFAEMGAIYTFVDIYKDKIINLLAKCR